MQPVETLPIVDWMRHPAALAVLNALAAGGRTGRFVGGAVRNQLLGLPVTDFDIATDAPPSQTLELAEAFGVPVLLNATLRDGSLRYSATESGTRILLYEAGQALRFDELSIRAGVKGVLNILGHLGLVKRKPRRQTITPFVCNQSNWIRANCSGIVHNVKNLGDQVEKGDCLAEIGSPFGDIIDKVRANRSGIIIGKQNIPLVQEGDAMFHIAYFSEPDAADIVENIEVLHETLIPDQDDSERDDHER